MKLKINKNLGCSQPLKLDTIGHSAFLLYSTMESNFGDEGGETDVLFGPNSRRNWPSSQAAFISGVQALLPNR